ncbi:SIMPL domain-containing protein [Sphingomonas sp.]|uniref:SIMPL domain-containing protein n=1 Tax=Sphingomonas sp. TaxID=28214 RepID=UPI003F820321
MIPIFPATAQSFKSQPNTIMVAASGSVETQPDTALLSVVIRGEGKAPDDATRALAAKIKAITSGLRSIDPQIEIQTNAVAIGEVYAGDCNRDAGLSQSTDAEVSMAADALADEADRLAAGARRTSPKVANPCAVTGYTARSEASVKMRKVHDAGTAVGLAGRLGASSAALESFDLSADDDARSRATAAAIANARAQAQAIAAGSGMKLGGIVSVTDGTGEGGLVMEKLAPVLNAYEVAPASPPPVAVDIAPKPVTTNARLVVTFALGK